MKKNKHIDDTNAELLKQLAEAFAMWGPVVVTDCDKPTPRPSVVRRAPRKPGDAIATINRELAAENKLLRELVAALIYRLENEQLDHQLICEAKRILGV